MKTIVDPQISLADFYSPPLLADQQFVALAEAMDPLLRQFVQDLQRCIIYSNLGNQPEWLYDFLAFYCFDVDYYDLSFPLEIKRKLVQEMLYRKSLKGTPYGVAYYLSLAFAHAQVVEWFDEPQYGNPIGPANTFRIQIADSLVDPVKVANVIRLILAIKNARTLFLGISSLAFANVPPLRLGVGVASYTYYRPVRFPTLVT